MLQIEEIIKTLGLEDLSIEEQAELLTSIEEATVEIALDELTADLAPDKIEDINTRIEASETLSEAVETIISQYPEFATLYENATKVFLTELAKSFAEEEQK